MIFKRNTQIISVLLLSLSSVVIFNIFEFYHTNNNYWHYFYNNHSWDEINTYFLKIHLVDQGKYSFNLIDDTYVFISTFFSFIQNFILYKIFKLNYLNLSSNIFIFLMNFYLFYIIFCKILNIPNLHNLYLACFFTLTIGYGPQTYNEIFEIISLNSTHLLALTRSESPGNTNICFLISLLLFLNKDKNFIFLFFSLLVSFYSYFYNTLILFVFFNIIFFYEFIKNKYKFTKKIFLSILLTLFFFLLWCYLILQSDPNGYFQDISNKTSPNDLKTLIISLIYISINLLSIKISNKKINLKNNSIYLIFFQISFLFCYYSNLITGISLGGEDHFYYFSNITYWLTILNFFLILKVGISKFIPILFSFFAIFLLIAQYNYSLNYFIEYKKNLEIQTKYFESLYEIKKYLNEKNIIVLDIPTINFFNYYLDIDNQLISYQNNNYNSKERLDRFIKTCHIIKIYEDDCYELIFKKSNILYFKSNVNIAQLFFGLDLDDDFYHSITSEKFHKIEFKEIFNFFYREYNDYNNLPNLIIFNHIDYPEINLKKIDYKTVFRNNFFTILKKI